MNLLTIIVIIIFAISVLHGYRRGFIKSLASMVSIVLSIVLVNIATPYVTEFLKTQTPLYDYILEKCEDAFRISDTDGSSGGQTETEAPSGGTEAADGTVNLAALDKQSGTAADMLMLSASDTGENALPAGRDNGTAETENNAGTRGESGTTASAQDGNAGWQDEWIDNLKIPQALRDLLKENNTPEYYRRIAADSFAEYVPRYMAGLILSLISFVVTWVLVISFIWLAVMMLDVIVSLPVLRGINQILGLVLGFLQGLIIVWVAFLIITIFSSTDIGGQLMEMIAESPVLSGIYDTNLLLEFLQDTVKSLF
ncbi:hypothetical protein BRYFOR_09654 [Marvinbryantia formatexigens DSM 14469]|uniref:CvpA family protein n=1 Tax=Marvinbryantia formatexigens DSM 14469 TaxID=478749 RepID=C6LLV5_9FIRM|nr:CvpA family protein [Marvinbryantia formatexigens]EET58424.1 hypothetical protein BRYFOR_09654 [Marvinbryantia formatexigens DSM 14469]UWO26355.1 CvpA family protein [Marvinbryantia formatexigens DSM 14469]SDH25005.1 Colicin V production protein [Marvinbryantia formatexigens]